MSDKGESLRDRLTRLRRAEYQAGAAGQAPAAPNAPNANAPPLPAWARKRLQRTLGKAPSPSGKLSASHANGPRVARTLGMPKGLQEVTCPRGKQPPFSYRETVLPEDHRHGSMPLTPNGKTNAEAFVLLTEDSSLAKLDLSEVVFLDTETTGLSGGAGVFVFMVGLARFVQGRWHVWQGFLRGPEEEAAMLGEAARRIADSGGVVSFFGKSFDRHRLEDKMRIHGVEPPFDGTPHLDLYHPLRRLHKGVFADTKLQTMERELCGFQRTDDLPGSLAPEAWFDFLGARPHRIEGVFRHNLEDVLSLVTLAYWLENVLQRRGEESLAAATQREMALAKALHKAGSGARAVDRLARHLGQTEEPAVWHLRAQIEDRLARYPEALDSVRTGLAQGTNSPAAVRLFALRSKVMEHREKDWNQAAADCQSGLAALANLRTFQGRDALERELSRRLERLENKRSRP